MASISENTKQQTRQGENTRPAEELRAGDTGRMTDEQIAALDFTFDPLAAMGQKLHTPPEYTLDTSSFVYRWATQKELPVMLSQSPVFGLWEKCHVAGKEISDAPQSTISGSERVNAEKYYLCRKDKRIYDKAQAAKDNHVWDTLRQIESGAIVTGKDGEGSVQGNQVSHVVEGQRVTMTVTNDVPPNALT